jgi:hypothetical protein
MNKKLTIIIVIAFIVVGAAAFIGGRLLNGGIGPLGMMLPFGPGGGNFSYSFKITPAKELPAAHADLTGLYVSRKDNTLTVQSMSMKGEGGGIVISRADGGSGGDTGPAVSSVDMGSGPKMEVVVTGKTIIYRDSTAMNSEPPTSQETTVQQTVETGTLDDIHDQTMITVWGRKVGDRLIADVLLYSNPVIIRKTK